MVAEYAENDFLESDETVSCMQFTNAPPRTPTHLHRSIKAIGKTRGLAQLWIMREILKPYVIRNKLCLLSYGISPLQILNLPVRRNCNMYYCYLAAKGRGSPMWEPEPSSTLPNIYRRRGITVGDVGIITASGGFDFMFNVCLPSDHPINQEGLPEGFLPIFPQLRSSDIRRCMAYNKNSYLASESVLKSHRESGSSYVPLMLDT